MKHERKNPSFSADLNSFPIFRILIGTVIGILVEFYFSFGILTPSIGIALSLAALSAMYFSKKLSRKHAYNFLNGTSLYLLWIFFGMFIVDFQAVEKPDISANQSPMKIAVVTHPTEEKEKSFKVQMSVLDSANSQTYNVIAYFEKTDNIPQCGDLVGFFSDIQYLENSKNPLEFDYAKYMQRQGVYCRTYVKKNEFMIVCPAYEKGFRYYGSLLRDKLLEIYRSQGFSDKQLSVLEALTLGYKADLDDETISAFQASGSMHILAVSGLHTGIIMMIISWLLNFLNRSGRGRVIKFLVIIVVLWTFAAITGFSASVCRSALMFSLVAFGNTLNRTSSTYTTLAFSAFVLLIINPLQLFNVGFLLSYFAVISIVAVVPLLENLNFKINFLSDSKLKIAAKSIANYFIGIILVSVAAQVGTTILSIGTFNQFPIYFMLTNILVIPLSFLIMISAVVMLALSWIPGVCVALTALLKLLLDILLGSVSWIESLPGSCIKGLYLTNCSSVLLYIFVVSMVIFFIYKKLKAFKFALLVFVVFLTAQFYFGSIKYSKESFIVYNKNYSSCISVLKSDTCKVFTNKREPNSSFLSPIISHSELSGFAVSGPFNLDSLQNLNENFQVVDNCKILIISNFQQYEILKTLDLDVDILVVSRNLKCDFDDLLSSFKPEKLIFDSSNKQEYVAQHSLELSAKHIDFHDVATDGAFVLGRGTETIWWY